MVYSALVALLQHWRKWISLPAVVNLTVSLDNKNNDVNPWREGDDQHCVDDDSEGLIAWISEITGVSAISNIDVDNGVSRRVR